MLRQIDVSAQEVAAGDTAALASMLSSDLEPAAARQLQGSLVFMFPELEVEDKRIFDMPGVVDWFALLHHRIPHLVYFLQPSPMSGALEALLLTLLPPDGRSAASDAGAVPLTDEILTALAERLVACATYATEKGDDWEPIVERFVAPLGEGAQELLVEVVREATA